MQYSIGYFRIITTVIGFFNGCFIDNPVIPPQILAVFIQPLGTASGHAAFRQAALQVTEPCPGNGLMGFFHNIFDFQCEIAFMISIGYGFPADETGIFQPHVIQQILME